MSVARDSKARSKICATRSGERGGRGDLLELLADVALALGEVGRLAGPRAARAVVGGGLASTRSTARSPWPRDAGRRGRRRGRGPVRPAGQDAADCRGLDQGDLLEDQVLEPVLGHQLELQGRLAEVEVVLQPYCWTAMSWAAESKPSWTSRVAKGLLGGRGESIVGGGHGCVSTSGRRGLIPGPDDPLEVDGARSGRAAIPGGQSTRPSIVPERAGHLPDGRARKFSLQSGRGEDAGLGRASRATPIQGSTGRPAGRRRCSGQKLEKPLSSSMSRSRAIWIFSGVS